MANVIDPKDLHRVVLTCIVHDGNGKFLITKRPPTQKAFPNKWTVPGGGLELSDYIDLPKTIGEAWYEVLDDVLRREVKEEVNLEIDFPHYLVDMIFVRPDGVPVVIFSYYAQRASGEVKLEAEAATEHVWVTADEAKSYDLIEGIREEIVMVDKILKGDMEARIDFNG